MGAKKLSEASYAFAKEVDWNNGLYLQAPGQFQPLKALTAIDKMIVLGAQADPKLLSAAAAAHHKAIGSISGPDGVTSKADWEAVNAALGRVFASVPEATVMDVYNAVKDITDPGVPAYLKSLVNGADAERAYAAFLEFKDVVKKNQVSAPGPVATAAPAKYASIDAAAKSLSDASYPFLKEVDWTSSLYLKPLPGATAKDALKAIDKAIVMGIYRWQPFEGSGGGPPQGHRQHRCQGRDLGGRLCGRERSSRQGHCVGADRSGHGRLQCLCEDCARAGPEHAVQLGEPIGRQCRGEGFLHLKGRGEGSSALSLVE